MKSLNLFKNYIPRYSKLGIILFMCVGMFFWFIPVTWAAEGGLDGAKLSIWWILPFAGILLSIAVFPLAAPHFWHKHYGKISAFWGLCIAVALAVQYSLGFAIHEILHVYLLEYIPFIILLLSLYTISGGIYIEGNLKGTPKLNTILMLIGTLLASWMGTTGAAMLLIRPLLRANENRKYKIHTVVFFIFLVANIGGSLSPLGDPPLFLGFLQGVSFFWVTKALFLPMVFATVVLLVIYYIMDTLFMRKEDKNAINLNKTKEAFRLHGVQNIFLLLLVVLCVLLSGIVDLGSIHLSEGLELKVINVCRDLSLLLLTYLSLKITASEVRKRNDFTWFPIVEVAKLFAGIFITIIPPLAMLKAAKSGEGALQYIQTLIFTPDGMPINKMFMWMTGILSAFLDNAPTYLVFFSAAGGDANILMNEMSETLFAISVGAVFFGAMSYIGNAPNFMVRSIAESKNIKMPSFGGFLLWAICILIPVFLLVTVLFL